MGTHLCLAVQPECIDAADWRAAYDDSLRILDLWPGDFVRRTERDVAGVRVIALTSDLELDVDDPARRRWRIDGDRRSLRAGETHGLPRRLGGSRGSSVARDDVLLELLDGRAQFLFDHETGGAPYHEPLLAVAMMIEDRFPTAAVAGESLANPDIVDRAAELVARAVGHRPALPVRMSRARLRARLEAAERSCELDEAVDRLYLPPASPAYRALAPALLELLAAGERGLAEVDLERLVALDSIDDLEPLQRHAIDGMICTAVDLSPSRFSETSDALRALAERVGRRIPLTEDTWTRLSRVDTMSLQVLLGFAAMPDPPRLVQLIRRAVFESPPLLRHATALAANPTVRAQIRRDVLASREALGANVFTAPAERWERATERLKRVVRQLATPPGAPRNGEGGAN